MKTKLFLAIVFTIFIQKLTFGQQKGTVIREFINAPSLKQNILGEPLTQPIAVYLPPSYNKDTNKRYPVVYFLIGWSDTIGDFIRGNNDYIPGYVFENSMNANVTQGRTKEMIMVIVNGYSVLQGSFYYNSVVTGNWEDFVVKDVIKHMDAKYRTIPNVNSRALMGTSMGGYGALILSMRHPSVFSIGLGFCPGLATPTGLKQTGMFSDVNVIKNVINFRNELAKYPRDEAHKRYLAAVKKYITAVDWTMMFSLGYGSAFAPDTNLIAPYFEYPYSYDNNNNLILDSVIYKKYEVGFGNLKKKVEVYKDSLLKLKGYMIDYSSNDGNTWIPDGCVYFDKELSKANIPHKVLVQTGGHAALLKKRTEGFQLPYLDSLLIHDTLHLNSNAKLESFSITGQIEEPAIDTVNKIIKVQLKSTVNLANITANIVVSSGAKIITFPYTYERNLNLSTGSANFSITSENEKKTANWTVNAKLALGIEQETKIGTIQIFPNPAIENFTIKAGFNIIEKVEIIDLLGKVVSTQYYRNNSVSVNRENLRAGSYFVKISTNEGEYFKKVLFK
jgi:S-formylglutathione hydrolase FrmB